jgi:hypothetical protein
MASVEEDGRLTVTAEAEQRCLEQEAASRSRKDSEVDDRRPSKPEY